MISHDYELTARAREICHKHRSVALAEQVTVAWNSRMRSTAGRAFLGTAVIQLNPRLRDFAAEEIERTFLHELAHLIAFARFGKLGAGHGLAWRMVCSELGIAGESRCHSLPLPRRKMEYKWIYQCPTCGKSIRRVRRMKRIVACSPCCKRENGGKYHAKFRLQEKMRKPLALGFLGDLQKSWEEYLAKRNGA